MVIIGSGFAGAYAAYRLSPKYGSKLCVLEKESRDGGRIIDFSETPGGPKLSAGPYINLDGQLELVALANELGIVQQTRTTISVSKYRVRGHYYEYDIITVYTTALYSSTIVHHYSALAGCELRNPSR